MCPIYLKKTEKTYEFILCIVDHINTILNKFSQKNFPHTYTYDITTYILLIFSLDLCFIYFISRLFIYKSISEVERHICYK